MKPGHYRDLIDRASADKNDALLDSVAERLAACEEAMRILRARGYGQTGMSIDAVAREVPPAPKN